MYSQTYTIVFKWYFAWSGIHIQIPGLVFCFWGLSNPVFVRDICNTCVTFPQCKAPVAPPFVTASTQFLKYVPDVVPQMLKYSIRCRTKDVICYHENVTYFVFVTTESIVYYKPIKNSLNTLRDISSSVCNVDHLPASCRYIKHSSKTAQVCFCTALYT